MLYIKKQVLMDIENSIGRHHPETGGILGCSKDGAISHFLFDYNQKSTSYKYVPAVDYLNDYMKANWYQEGVIFCGMVHSHPNHAPSLSQGDLIYARRIIENFNHLEHLYLLLVLMTDEPQAIHYFKTFLNEYHKIEIYQLDENEVHIIE